jgi:hypothetical protein
MRLWLTFLLILLFFFLVGLAAAGVCRLLRLRHLQ